MTLLRPSSVRRIALLLTLLGTLGGCSALGLDGESGERARLERQKARWARQNMSSYRFTYAVSCFCERSGQPVEIEVRSNAVTAAAYRETDQPLPIEVVNQLPTVDELFRKIDRAILEKVDLLEVTYHPTMGYPTRIAVDRSFNWADDEIVHVVTALARITAH